MKRERDALAEELRDYPDAVTKIVVPHHRQ